MVIKDLIERIALNNDINNSKSIGVFGFAPLFFLLSFIWFILICSLFCRAEYCSYKYLDNPAWAEQNTIFLILSSGLFLAVAVLIYMFSRHLDNFKRTHVLFTIIYLSVLAQLLFILYFPAKQFADQDIVNRIAYEIIDNNYNAFQERGYLYQYPNNIGIAFLLSVIYRIFPQALMVPKLLNIVFSTVTSFLIFRIYEEAFPQKNTNDFALIFFSSFFPPMIMLNNLVYNDIYATTLFLGSIFNAMRFVKTENKKYLVLTGALLTLGNFLRQVGAVFLLAIIVYFVITRVPLLKSLAFFGIVLVLFRMPMFLVNNYLIETEKIPEPIGTNSIPIDMWIHMGMNDEKFGYWDDSYSLNIYSNQGKYEKEKSRQIYRMLINKKLEEKGLSNLAKVYIKKNIWLWTEGTYQAEYYGVGSWGHLYSTIATDKLDNSVLFRDSIRWTLHVINILMLSLIFIGLLECIIKKVPYLLLLPAIVVIGFIGFYTVWEIKPRYIYPIYPYMILMAYQGLSTLMDILATRIRFLSRLNS